MVEYELDVVCWKASTYTNR